MAQMDLASSVLAREPGARAGRDGGGRGDDLPPAGARRRRRLDARRDAARGHDLDGDRGRGLGAAAAVGRAPEGDRGEVRLRRGRRRRPEAASARSRREARRRHFVFRPSAAPAVAAGRCLRSTTWSGVGGGDRLNVRGGPDAQTAVLGRLRRTPSGIEVVAVDAAGAAGARSTSASAPAGRRCATSTPQPDDAGDAGGACRRGPPASEPSRSGRSPGWRHGRSSARPDRGDEAFGRSARSMTGDRTVTQRRALIDRGRRPASPE